MISEHGPHGPTGPAAQKLSSAAEPYDMVFAKPTLSRHISLRLRHRQDTPLHRGVPVRVPLFPLGIPMTKVIISFLK